jgi:ankyrin repeat protein
MTNHVASALLNDTIVEHRAAIRYASKNGHDKVIELLLKNDKVDPAADNNFAIRCASANGHVKVVEALLKDGRADAAADQNFAIRCASQNGHVEVVQLLLNDGRVDPSAENNFAIRCASQNGHDKVVQLLLKDERVDPAADDNFAIQKASKNGHDKVVELLFRSSKNVRMYIQKYNPEQFKYYNQKVQYDIDFARKYLSLFDKFNVLSILSDRTESGKDDILKTIRKNIFGDTNEKQREPISKVENKPKKARTSGAAKICQKCNLPIV